MKRFMVVAAILSTASCDNGDTAPSAPPGQIEASTNLILECEVKLLAAEGHEITQRRTYMIDLNLKTLRFWQDYSGVWVNGGSESRLTFETPSELTFQSNQAIGRIHQHRIVTFDRAIGSVQDSITLDFGDRERTTHSVGPCKSVSAPNLNSAF